jgi:hypothetical protein
MPVSRQYFGKKSEMFMESAGKGPGRPVTPEEQEDPYMELVEMGRRLGYTNMRTAEVVGVLSKLHGRREACSMVMDMMLARQPLSTDGPHVAA